MHNDQRRVKDIVLPLLATKIHSPAFLDEKDCTVVNRMLTQGPDPLFLMEAAPTPFFVLRDALYLDDETARAAINLAHIRGPASLFEEGTTGLPWEPRKGVALKEYTAHERAEMLWILLAFHSDCTEGSYKDDVTLKTRIEKAIAAALRLQAFIPESYTRAERGAFLLEQVFFRLTDYRKTTRAWEDEEGHPHTEADHGFYVLYKEGHKCVACHDQGGSVFWGTTPDTTLKEQGVVVEKEITPHYGIVFPPKEVSSDPDPA
jgi:hypothetical protein